MLNHLSLKTLVRTLAFSGEQYHYENARPHWKKFSHNAKKIHCCGNLRVIGKVLLNVLDIRFKVRQTCQPTGDDNSTFVSSALPFA